MEQNMEPRTGIQEEKKQEELKEILLECKKPEEIKFDASFKILLGISIFFVTVLFFIEFYEVSWMMEEQVWKTKLTTYFIPEIMLFLGKGILCVSLIMIAVRKKPFLKIVVRSMMIMGTLMLLASVLVPCLPGYPDGSFVIFHIFGYTFIDGSYFTPGILILLFAKITKYGVRYQMETESTI